MMRWLCLILCLIPHWVLAAEDLKLPQYGAAFAIPDGWQLKQSNNGQYAISKQGVPDSDGVFTLSVTQNGEADAMSISDVVRASIQNAQQMLSTGLMQNGYTVNWEAMDEPVAVPVRGGEAARAKLTGTTRDFQGSQRSLVVDMAIVRYKGNYFVFSGDYLAVHSTAFNRAGEQLLSSFKAIKTTASSAASPASGGIDQALLGCWKKLRLGGQLSGGSGNHYGYNTTVTYYPNGQYYYKSTSYMSFEGASGMGGGSTTTEEAGTWSTAAGVLTGQVLQPQPKPAVKVPYQIIDGGQYLRLGNTNWARCR